MEGIVKLQMRATVLLLPWLLLILLKPYQCLAAESSLGEKKVYLQDKEYQGLNVCKGEGIRGETKELDASERLTHSKKSGGGGKGGRSVGGGFSQITRQPPSQQQQRKSNAPPMTTSGLWPISICILLVPLSFF